MRKVLISNETMYAALIEPKIMDNRIENNKKEVTRVRTGWRDYWTRKERFNPALKILREIKNLRKENGMPVALKKKKTTEKKAEKPAGKVKEEKPAETSGNPPEYSLEQLKKLSNDDKRKLLKKLGLPIPNTKNENVAHMFLLGALKKYYGYGKDKKDKDEEGEAHGGQKTMLKTIINQNTKIIELLEKIVEN